MIYRAVDRSGNWLIVACDSYCQADVVRARYSNHRTYLLDALDDKSPDKYKLISFRRWYEYRHMRRTAPMVTYYC